MDILLIAVLLLISGFLSACEMAFSSVNKIRLKNYAQQGDKKAKLALKISDGFDKALTAILIGNNLVNIASAAIGTVIFTNIFGDKGVGIATGIMTVVVLIFGEILPKSIAKENAERVCLAFSGMLRFFIIILSPITWVFIQIKKLASFLIKSSDNQPNVTEDELKYIIDESEEQGVLEEQESNLVKSALEFDEIEVNEIIVPRVNVVGIEINESIEEIKMVFADEMYTRLPVYEKNLDNIIGIINEKDFFRMLVRGGDNIKDIIQPPLYIPEFVPISEVMHEMQKTKQHMAVILDQYGGTMGIVTLEDIIEELVGEIYDENDEVTVSVLKTGADTYEISGELSVSDMLEKIGLSPLMIESSSTTVGGWVMELFGEIPEEDDTITYGIFTVTVKKLDEQKIEKIILKVSISDDEE